MQQILCQLDSIIKFVTEGSFQHGGFDPGQLRTIKDRFLKGAHDIEQATQRRINSHYWEDYTEGGAA